MAMRFFLCGYYQHQSKDIWNGAIVGHQTSAAKRRAASQQVPGCWPNSAR
jgi:hypothetical protein